MKEHKKKTLLVVGAGGVGVYFASRIAMTEEFEVSVVARSDYDALQKQSGAYQIESCLGNYMFRPARIFHSVRDVDFQPDYLLISYKVMPELDPVETIRPLVGKNTVLLLIQNGIGNEEPFHCGFPENELIGHIAYIGVARPRPGLIRHFDGGKLIAGRYPIALPPSPAVLSFPECFKKGGLPYEFTENITLKRWVKLLWNASFNPLSVLGRSADTRIIMDDPDAVKLISGVMEEVIQIAEAEGCPIPRSMIRQNLDYTRTFAAYKPSTLQDYEAGKKIELDAILGKPLQIAEKHHLEVPCMKTMYALLKLMVRDR